MTSECVNALLALAEVHKDTGKYLSAIGSFLERENQLNNLINFTGGSKKLPLDKWIATERDNSARSCYLSLQRYSKHLSLQLNDLPHEIALENNKCFREEFLKISNKFHKNNQLKKGIEKSKEHIKAVIETIENYREKEEKDKTKESRDNLIRSHQGHHIAINALNEALNQSEEALKLFSNVDQIKIYEESQDILNKISNRIHRTLIPTQNYLSTILDRELAVGTELHYGHPEELVWATFSYGKLTNNWDKDNRLELATKRLICTISDYGIFPNRRHFHFDQEKRTIQTEASCVTNAFAQLIKHVRNVKIDDDITKKLLRLLEDTRVIKPNGKLDGWRKDCSPVHWKSDSDATAQAVLALDEINSMLDERINHLILEHFSVKWPELDFNKTPFLDQLFYSDYGLTSIYKDNAFKKLEKLGIPRKESIAVTLQRMQAHVRKISLDKKDKKSCNSIVLYGPAGTGKTFLVEALAKTCDVPMVEITPSDIVKRGVDNVERRARTVFEALSLLTRVVILFDEFDPVLKRRDPDNQNPSVFSFLTPGMLPKLKTLHDKAEKRSAAYVLITNLIGSLDEAAIRQGRFDEKIGIFPPDLLSRTGRFLYQYLINKKKHTKSEEHWSRITEIISKTSGKGMTTIGNPGWFTALIDNNDKITDILDSLESEDEFKGEIKGEGNIAEKEYYEWAWITKCDKELEKSLKENVNSLNCLGQTLENLPQNVDLPLNKESLLSIANKIVYELRTGF